MSIPDISALKGSFTHLFCCLPWGEQSTAETFLDSPEQPRSGLVCLGLLREGFQFPHPLPMDQALAGQGCSSHTGGHHSTTAVSPVTRWGLVRGAQTGNLVNPAQ